MQVRVLGSWLAEKGSCVPLSGSARPISVFMMGWGVPVVGLCIMTRGAQPVC